MRSSLCAAKAKDGEKEHRVREVANSKTWETLEPCSTNVPQSGIRTNTEPRVISQY